MKAKLASCFFLQFLFLFLFAPKALAQVVINEFSVVPPDKQDWIELYSIEVVDISNWIVADEAGEIERIPEGTILESGDYYLVSKYQRLNNDQDTIFLYDAEGKLIDSIKYGYQGEVCLPGPEGSIARIPDGAATYDRLAAHTKGAPNGSEVTDPCPTPTPEPTKTPTSVPTATPVAQPTKTPTPQPTVMATKTLQSTKEPVVSPANSAKPDQDELVLGLKEVVTEKPSPTPEGFREKKSPSFLAGLLIFSGLATIGLANYLFMKSRKASYNNKAKEDKKADQKID